MPLSRISINIMFCYVLILLLYCIYDIRSESKMEANIVGGNGTTIRIFPHSAGLMISCMNTTLQAYATWLCGGSIVNQKILLTAAHCFDGCEDMLPNSNRVRIEITIGSTYLRNKNYQGANYITHDDYDPISIECEIALIYVKQSITLGDNIKRILIPMKDPLVKFGYVAGWGVTNEETGQTSPTLKSLKQKIVSRHLCQGYLRTVPGTICAQSYSRSHADSGDSGCALVVKHLIAVGLVSHKHSTKHSTLTVYTDVHHYYKWIKKNAMKLYCHRR